MEMKQLRCLVSKIKISCTAVETCRIFKLPCEPFGVNDTERCIEIPWAISCYDGEEKVLDVGYANAEERYIRELLSLNIPALYGIDLVRKDVAGITSIKGDIRMTSFPDDLFNLILCISTIEHIGKDNSIYVKGYHDRDTMGDFKAINEMRRITKKGGKIILTVPYGKFHDYGWFINYDNRRWNDLIKFSGCKKVHESFFVYNGGWYNAKRSELDNILYQDNGAPAAAGLVCAVLKK